MNKHAVTVTIPHLGSAHTVKFLQDLALGSTMTALPYVGHRPLWVKFQFDFDIKDSMCNSFVKALELIFRPEFLQFHRAITAAFSTPAEELEWRLRRHDWSAEMSDDPGVWRSAEANMARIKELIPQAPNGADLWAKYGAHTCVE